MRLFTVYGVKLKPLKGHGIRKNYGKKKSISMLLHSLAKPLYFPENFAFACKELKSKTFMRESKSTEI